jgi:hypothetical protein
MEPGCVARLAPSFTKVDLRTVTVRLEAVLLAARRNSSENFFQAQSAIELQGTITAGYERRTTAWLWHQELWGCLSTEPIAGFIKNNPVNFKERPTPTTSRSRSLNNNRARKDQEMPIHS